MPITAGGIWYPEPDAKPRAAYDMQLMANSIEAKTIKKPLRNEVGPAESTSNTSALGVDLATVGPTVTVTTTSEDDIVSFFAEVNLTAHASAAARVHLVINDVPYGIILTQAAGAGSFTRKTLPGSEAGVGIGFGGWLALRGFVPGIYVCKLRYSASAAFTVTFANRILIARVG